MDHAAISPKSGQAEIHLSEASDLKGAATVHLYVEGAGQQSCTQPRLHALPFSLEGAAALPFSLEGGDALSGNSNPTQETLVSPDLARRKALVLSDNDGLARAIKAHISHRLDVEVVRMDVNAERQMEVEEKPAEFDLMVVALSSPTREPAEVLSKTRLAEQVGQVPLLVISDRPLEPLPKGQIIHLNLPFEVDEFHDKLRELLGIA